MIVIENVTVATVDAAGTEHADGHVVVGDDGRIAAVGAGGAGPLPGQARRVDGTGCLLTPGLINTHHHLYQWVTRGLAQDETLFGWLQTLYAMGERVLAQRPELAEIRLALPNKHHYLADLAPFGLDNPQEVFIAGDRPYGLIEGTVTRDDAPPAGTELYL